MALLSTGIPSVTQQGSEGVVAGAGQGVEKKKNLLGRIPVRGGTSRTKANRILGINMTFLERFSVIFLLLQEYLANL